MKVAVVTPTIGSQHLEKCIESVQNQTYENLTHYIFLDGEEHFAKIMMQGIDKNSKKKIKSIGLQENVGKGWYGHRVYAACSFLVNADIICYLDEDNWVEPEHVESLVKVIEQGNDWAYSLRKIYDKEGNYLCEDNCESLGLWPIYFANDQYHIDTSSFAVRQPVAVNIGHSWYGQWGADRKFFFNLKKYFPKYNCSLKHSLCYRLDGNPNSVTKEFFESGNKINFERYDGKLPWKTKNLEPHSLLVGPGISVQF